MKRGKTCSLTDDVSICVQMGWTYTELMEQPARFVERLQIYLSTVADIQEKENRRLEDELRRLQKRR